MNIKAVLSNVFDSARDHVQAPSGYGVESNSNVVKNIVNNKNFKIKIKNSVYSDTNPTEQSVLSKLGQFIDAYFFDSDFYYNYTDNGEKYLDWYKTNIKKPLLNNIDNFYHKYIDIVNGVWELKKILNREDLLENTFVNSKTLPYDVRYDWNLYRWDYAGEKPEPEVFEYVGEWPDKKITKVRKADSG